MRWLIILWLTCPPYCQKQKKTMAQENGTGKPSDQSSGVPGFLNKYNDGKNYLETPGATTIKISFQDQASTQTVFLNRSITISSSESLGSDLYFFIAAIVKSTDLANIPYFLFSSGDMLKKYALKTEEMEIVPLGKGLVAIGVTTPLYLSTFNIILSKVIEPAYELTPLPPKPKNVAYESGTATWEGDANSIYLVSHDAKKATSCVYGDQSARVLTSPAVTLPTPILNNSEIAICTKGVSFGSKLAKVRVIDGTAAGAASSNGFVAFMTKQKVAVNFAAAGGDPHDLADQICTDELTDAGFDTSSFEVKAVISASYVELASGNKITIQPRDFFVDQHDEDLFDAHGTFLGNLGTLLCDDYEIGEGESYCKGNLSTGILFHADRSSIPSEQDAPTVMTGVSKESTSGTTSAPNCLDFAQTNGTVTVGNPYGHSAISILNENLSACMENNAAKTYYLYCVYTQN